MLDGDRAPSPPKKGAVFGPCLLWPNAWMDQDAAWHRGRPQPSGLCVRWGPSPPKFSVHVYYGYCDFIHSFILSFGLNNTVQDIKVTKTLTYVLGLNTKHQHDIVR